MATMFDNTMFGSLAPMMGRMLQQNLNAPKLGMPTPAAGMPAGSPPASPGLLNNMLGMKPGMGLLNSLFQQPQQQPGQPINILPQIPVADNNAPGPNALTGMW